MKKTEILPFFVYGTLLPGQPNDFYWKSDVLRTEPAVYLGANMFAFPHFPMITETGDQSKQIKGELIWVDESRYIDVLQQIDFLEGFDPSAKEKSIYQRLKRDVVFEQGKKEEAWIYIGSADFVSGLPQISSGDWVDYLHNKTDPHLSS